MIIGNSPTTLVYPSTTGGTSPERPSPTGSTSDVAGIASCGFRKNTLRQCRRCLQLSSSRFSSLEFAAACCKLSCRSSEFITKISDDSTQAVYFVIPLTKSSSNRHCRHKAHPARHCCTREPIRVAISRAPCRTAAPKCPLQENRLRLSSCECTSRVTAHSRAGGCSIMLRYPGRSIGNSSFALEARSMRQGCIELTSVAE